MLLAKKRGLYEASRVIYVTIDDIATSPSIRRDEAATTTSATTSLRALSASIAKYGILQPLSVRRAPHGFELISGERRLRAAKLAGLREAPCIVLDVGEEASAAIVLVENLQRRDLDFIDEAHALERLRTRFSYTQEEVARLVGRSQPAVANKLRLLKLPEELLYAVREAGLTERHARALLRLSDEAEAAAALSRMISEDMNVSRAEELVEELLRPPAPPVAEVAPEPVAPPETTVIIRDYRFFINTIERGAEMVRKSGYAVVVARTESEDDVVLTVKIPKKAVYAALP